MPSRLSTLFRSIFESLSKAFNCIRKPKDADELGDISKPLFLCYKLPLDAQEHIVRSMDTYEIMQSSLVSPRFRVAARPAKPKLGFLSFAEQRYLGSYTDDDGILEVFGKLAPTIQFEVNDYSNYSISFLWREQKDQLDLILEGREFIKISEDHWMAVVGCNIVIYNSSAIHSELDDYQFIFDIIFQVFTVDCFNLGERIWPDCVLSKKHMLALALRYRNLVQYSKIVQSRKSCTALNSDELTLLLDNLKMPRIKILWEVEPGTEYAGTLKTKEMKLHRASWLTMDHIMTMECEKFTGSGPRWTGRDLISIVRKWQDGGFEKLKRLDLENDHEDENWSDVLYAIEGTKMPEWYMEGKYIHRSDGKKAEVTVDQYDFMINVLD